MQVHNSGAQKKETSGNVFHRTLRGLTGQQESLDLDQSTRAAACAALPPRHVITAASMIPTAICRLRSLPPSQFSTLGRLLQDAQ